MKPDFALDFRDSQITLLHRQEGGWASIGRVAMDDPDLDAAMSYLRATALGLSPRGIATKLILPNDAILYTNLPNLPLDAGQRAAQIARDLHGRTPYSVEDLIWDWTDNGASADVAVIARETLAEAEGFATQHRFNPISFAAIPNSGSFVGEVWFGLTALSDSLLAQGQSVERDTVFAFAPPVAKETPDPGLTATDFEMGASNDDGAGQNDPPAAGSDAQPAVPPVEPAMPPTDTPPDDAPFADITEDQPQFWQDFVEPVAEPETDLVADPEAAPIADQQNEGQQQSELPLHNDTPLLSNGADDIAPPASFDDAMAEAQGAEPQDDSAMLDASARRADAPQEEAPMALDVPLIDGDARDDDDLTFLDNDGAQPLAKDSAALLAEKQPSKAEKMLAAFSARRAAALAKAEAATNAARADPVLSAPITAAQDPSAFALASAGQADDAAAIPAPAAPPKLGAASPNLGKAPEITANAGLKPAQIKHLPAKDLPPRPQNLKAMPKVKPARRGIALGWILTAALLIALVAGAAVSSYLLESFNALFVKDRAVASASAPATAAEPASLTVVASPVLPPVAVPPPQSDQTVAAPAVLPLPSLPLPSLPLPSLPLPSLPAAPPLPDAALAAAQITPATAPALPPSAPVAPETDVSAETSPEIPVIAAAPPIVPAPRPADIAPIATVPADPAVAAVRPAPRPGDIAPQAAPALAADPTLAGLRPLARPDDILDAGRAARLASAPASLVASAEINADEAALTDTAALPAPDLSPLALSVSLVPAARPAGLRAAFDAARDAEIVAAAASAAAVATAPEPAPEPEPEPRQTAAASPAAPEIVEETEEVVTNSGGVASRSVVARQATLRNAINLRDVNLVGIFGSNANRYALIRQPAGTFRKLKVGDRFDGGQIAAITESEVRYAKGGQMLALQMPDS